MADKSGSPLRHESSAKNSAGRHSSMVRLEGGYAVPGAAGMGALFVTLLVNGLPDGFVWKHSLVLIAPAVSSLVAIIVQHVSRASHDYIAGKRLVREVQQLIDFLHICLADPSTSDSHKTELRNRLQELELLVADTKLARIRELASSGTGSRNVVHPGVGASRGIAPWPNPNTPV